LIFNRLQIYNSKARVVKYFGIFFIVSTKNKEIKEASKKLDITFYFVVPYSSCKEERTKILTNSI